MGFDKIWRTFFEQRFTKRVARRSLTHFAKTVELPIVQHAYIDFNAIIVEGIRSEYNKNTSTPQTDLAKFLKDLQEDSNLYYPCLPSKEKMDIVVQEILKNVVTFYEKVNPIKTFYIALDGPGQIAKIETRRMRAIDRIKKEAVRFDLYKDDFVSTLMISSGTYFMHYLETQLQAWMKEQSLKKPTCQFVFSGSTTPGEGELKILQHIHQVKEHSDVFMILSPDSDMYMASLNVRQKQHIYVLRKKMRYELISKVEIMKKIQISHECNQLDRLLTDYIFLGLLYGSDFTRKIKHIIPPYQVCKLYKQYMINTKYKEFLIDMNETEISLNVKLLYDILKPKNKNRSKQQGPKELAYYFQSILWIMDQYTHGLCKDMMYQCTPHSEYNINTLGKLSKMKPVIRTAFKIDNLPYCPIISTIIVHKNTKIMFSLLPDAAKEVLQKNGMQLLQDIAIQDVNAELFDMCSQLNEILKSANMDDPYTKFALTDSETVMYVDGKVVPFVLKPLFHKPIEYKEIENPIYKVIKSENAPTNPTNQQNDNDKKRKERPDSITEPPTKKQKIAP